MGKTLARRALGFLLPLCLLALLLHAHEAPGAFSGLRLDGPESDCPACATLQGGVNAPDPPVLISPASIEFAAPPPASASPVVGRRSGPPSLRGPPPQA